MNQQDNNNNKNDWSFISTNKIMFTCCISLIIEPGLDINNNLYLKNPNIFDHHPTSVHHSLNVKIREYKSEGQKILENVVLQAINDDKILITSISYIDRYYTFKLYKKEGEFKPLEVIEIHKKLHLSKSQLTEETIKKESLYLLCKDSITLLKKPYTVDELKISFYPTYFYLDVNLNKF